MAHHYRTIVEPHKNKDGSESKVRKDYRVIHRGRGGRYEVGVATSQKAADALIAEDRVEHVWRHATKHTHDHKFLEKNGRRTS